MPGAGAFVAGAPATLALATDSTIAVVVIVVVLVVMVVMRRVPVPVVEIVDMVTMAHRLVPAAGPVLVAMDFGVRVRPAIAAQDGQAGGDEEEAYREQHNRAAGGSLGVIRGDDAADARHESEDGGQPHRRPKRAGDELRGGVGDDHQH